MISKQMLSFDFSKLQLFKPTFDINDIFFNYSNSITFLNFVFTINILGVGLIVTPYNLVNVPDFIIKALLKRNICSFNLLVL